MKQIPLSPVSNIVRVSAVQNLACERLLSRAALT